MRTINLQSIEHPYKNGNRCPSIEPNVVEDTLFVEDGKPIGFYLTNITGKIKKLLDIVDVEFRSKNVPKTLLERSDVFNAVYEGGMTRKQARATKTIQMSAILGSLLPKPHMKRPYPCASSVHQSESAKNYIRAMMLIAKESEKLLKKHLPETYKEQKELVKENVPERWQFTDLFTGSISNYNVPAPFHQDNANLQGGVNVIFTTRRESSGGHLHIPDYDATIEMADNSICVYPAWKNLHGVTPIQCEDDRSFRNTHIFYALKGFDKYE